MYSFQPILVHLNTHSTAYRRLCLNRSIRSMHFFTDQAKESVISVISAQCLQFIHQPVKQESRVSFTSCSLANSHLSFTAKSWWLWEYSVAFCNHLPFASSVALRISGKDAEVVAHPPSTSMVPLGTLVTAPLESGGLRTPKPSPGPVVHRVLPHCFSRLWDGALQTRWAFISLNSEEQK